MIIQELESLYDSLCHAIDKTGSIKLFLQRVYEYIKISYDNPSLYQSMENKIQSDWLLEKANLIKCHQLEKEDLLQTILSLEQQLFNTQEEEEKLDDTSTDFENILSNSLFEQNLDHAFNKVIKSDHIPPPRNILSSLDVNLST